MDSKGMNVKHFNKKTGAVKVYHYDTKKYYKNWKAKQPEKKQYATLTDIAFLLKGRSREDKMKVAQFIKDTILNEEEKEEEAVVVVEEKVFDNVIAEDTAKA